MKLLSREFTPREKLLLAVLGIVLIGALYFVWVDRPVRFGLRTTKQQVNALQIERDTINLKVAEIHGMESEMQDLKAKGVVASRMPSYNASNEELDFLHLILGATSDYYIDFTDVTREGDQIRRNFSLQYRTSNYKTALQVLDQLENSEIRCRIGDLSVSPSGESNNIMNGPVQVSVQATFFETMQGGEADAELPEDSAVNEEVGE